MKQTIIEHLEELRKGLIIIFVSLFIGFVIGLFFVDYFVKNINVVENIKIIAVSPEEVLLTKLWIALIFGFILSLPIFLYEGIKFLKPGLNKKEKKLLSYSIIIFIFLFIVGVIFGYFFVLNLGLAYLANIGKGIGVENYWSFSKLFHFSFTILLGSGVVFQLPFVLILLNKLGFISYDWLKRKRRYAYVLILLIAAIITPPDVPSMLLMGIPLIILYEISLIIIRIV